MAESDHCVSPANLREVRAAGLLTDRQSPFGLYPTVDKRKNGIRVLVAVGICAYTTGTSATLMIERFVRMHFAHPALIAGASSGLFSSLLLSLRSHTLSLTNELCYL